jgi:hypothetical protein
MYSEHIPPKILIIDKYLRVQSIHLSAVSPFKKNKREPPFSLYSWWCCRVYSAGQDGHSVESSDAHMYPVKSLDSLTVANHKAFKEGSAYSHTSAWFPCIIFSGRSLVYESTATSHKDVADVQLAQQAQHQQCWTSGRNTWMEPSAIPAYLRTDVSIVVYI